MIHTICILTDLYTRRFPCHNELSFLSCIPLTHIESKTVTSHNNRVRPTNLPPSSRYWWVPIGSLAHFTCAQPAQVCTRRLIAITGNSRRGACDGGCTSEGEVTGKRSSRGVNKIREDVKRIRENVVLLLLFWFAFVFLYQLFSFIILRLNLIFFPPFLSLPLFPFQYLFFFLSSTFSSVSYLSLNTAFNFFSSFS